MKTALALAATIAFTLFSGAAASTEMRSRSESEHDCVLIAAVLRQHYGFDETPRREPLISFWDAYVLECDWTHYGIAAPSTYDPDGFPFAPRSAIHFSRPKHGPGTAVIETSHRRDSRVLSWRCDATLSGYLGWVVVACHPITPS